MKIIKLVFSLLLLTSSHIFAQENDGVSVSKNQKKPSFLSFDNEAEIKFQLDLKSNNLKIYVLGGIKSVIQKEDVEFEKQYRIQYYDFGCTPPPNFKVYEQYNQFVFKYLVQENGEKWIPFVNKNAFGFAKWKP